jgi:Aspartyl protease
MIHALLLAATLAVNAPVIRLAPHAARAARYVRLQLDVTAYGIAGRGEIVVDRESGAFVRRFDAGPASEREGWDGARAWRADATGMPRVEGNADERGGILAWSHVFAPHAQPCGCGTRAPELTADAETGNVTAVVQHVGHQTERTTFAGYRTEGAFVVPLTITDTSENGVWEARVRAVETPNAVPASAFAPPPAPHDFALDGVAEGRLLGGIPSPLVDVVVNGTALRFILDTGGQNVITPDAARRAGLHVEGAGTVGGAGPAVAKIQYASARSVAVGAAVMRDQPFVVLDFGRTAPFDGIVGYELLARFALRLDFARERYALAADGRAFAGAGTEVPFVFDERQPQIDGALDGIPGAMTIDTGSSSGVDVSAPFVQAHDLRARYHAVVADSSIFGVGGPVRAYHAHGDELRLGALRINDIPLLLTDALAGAFANPTVAANVGMQVLRRYDLVLDYRRQIIRFEPVPAPAPTSTPVR